MQLPVEVDAAGRQRAQYATVASRLFTRPDAVTAPPDDVVLALAAAASEVPQASAKPVRSDVEMSDAPSVKKPNPTSNVDCETISAPSTPDTLPNMTEVTRPQESAHGVPSKATSTNSEVPTPASLTQAQSTEDSSPQINQNTTENVADPSGATEVQSIAPERAVPASKKSKKSSSGSNKQDKGQTSPDKKKVRVAREGASETAEHLRPVAQKVAAKLKTRPPDETDIPSATAVATTEPDGSTRHTLVDPWWQDVEMESNEGQISLK